MRAGLAIFLCACAAQIRPVHDWARSHPVSRPLTVAVVGGGIAGLTAAHVLRDAGVNVLVFEASDHLGGRAASERVRVDGDEYVFQHGAQMLSTGFTTIQSLLRELGLRGQVRPIGAYAGYVQDGRVWRLGANDAFSLHRSRILDGGSWWGWGMSYFWEWRETLRRLPLSNRAAWWALDDRDGRWFTKEWGGQVARYADTLQRALYFYGIEGTSRTVFLNLLAFRAHGETPGSLVDGFGALARALARRLDVRLNRRVRTLEILPDGVRVTTDAVSGASPVISAASPPAVSSGGESVVVDRVILATPAKEALRLHPAPSPAERTLLDHVTYASTINVVVVADRAWHDDPRLRGIYGLVIPRTEQRADDTIASISFESGRCPRCVPAGHELLHIMLADESAGRLMTASDEEIEQRVIDEATRFVPGLREHRRFARVFRYREAIARSPVGRALEIAQYRDSVRAGARILLAGDYGGWDSTEGAAETGDWAAGKLLKNQ